MILVLSGAKCQAGLELLLLDLPWWCTTPAPDSRLQLQDESKNVGIGISPRAVFCWKGTGLVSHRLGESEAGGTKHRPISRVRRATTDAITDDGEELLALLEEGAIEDVVVLVCTPALRPARSCVHLRDSPSLWVKAGDVGAATSVLLRNS